MHPQNTTSMALRRLLKFLLNPSHSIHNLSPFLQNYLQSTPLTPSIDVLSTTYTPFVLICQGIPFWHAVGTIPHLLARRQENHADALHSHDHTARLRLFFSLLWTSVLIFSTDRHDGKNTAGFTFRYLADWVLFWINSISILALLAPHLQKPSTSEHWASLKAFNALLDRHHVSPSRIERIYHWKGNAAIWLHCVVLISPFARLIWDVSQKPHPVTIVISYIWFCAKTCVLLLVAFGVSAVVGFASLKVCDVVSPTRDYDWQGGTARTLLAGVVASLCYAGVGKLVLMGRFVVGFWIVSDALLWAALEGGTAWLVMMSQDDFGNYLRQRAWERERIAMEEGMEEGEGGDEEGLADEDGEKTIGEKMIGEKVVGEKSDSAIRTSREEN